MDKACCLYISLHSMDRHAWFHSRLGEKVGELICLCPLTSLLVLVTWKAKNFTVFTIKNQRESSSENLP